MKIIRNIRRAGLIAAAVLALGAGPALACSCAPAESAEAQAAGYDLVAVVTVGESWALESESETAEAEAYKAYQDEKAEALRTYAEALAAGEDVPPLADFMDNFYSQSTYRPAPYVIGSHLTMMHVQSVLKGEMSRHVVVKSMDPGMPACGVRYRPGAQVLLLAQGSNGVYRTSMCDRAQFPLEDFEEALNTE